MKLLIISQRYWPESFRITDIAESLSTAGHGVTVLTGLPNYPQGIVWPDYQHGKNRNEEHNGVRIIRAKEIGRRKGIVFRFLNYWSFPFFANKAVRKLESDFDVVLINELSPIMGAKPGLKYAKKHGKKVVMYEMDLWPESLLAGGISTKSPIYKHYKKVSARIYSSCDKILVSTKEHERYIHQLPNCEKLDIEYLPQYAEPLFEDLKLAANKSETINLLFAGNIGKAQSIDTIVRAAGILKDDQRFAFHIVGGGSELESAKSLASSLNLPNITFYGPKPLKEMPAFYEKADVMLVSLENRSYANMTVPGKVQSYMACGKPIIGSIAGATAALISESGCGVAVQPESPEALAEAISKLTPESIAAYSARSKEYYDTHFMKKLFMAKLEETLRAFSK